MKRKTNRHASVAPLIGLEMKNRPAREADKSIKPRVERSGTLGSWRSKRERARAAGDRTPAERIFLIGPFDEYRYLFRPLRGLGSFVSICTQGFAALHP